MDSPPKKRRRTSPRLSERNSQTDRDASNAPTTTTPPDPPPGTDNPRSNRPSFASPTRASLAKHNPQILERRKSVPRSQGNGHSEANSAFSASRRASRESDTEVVDGLLDEQSGQSAEKAGTALAQAVGSQRRRPLQQPPSRSPSRSPTRNMFLEPPRRTPVKPIPRPLPPPDPARSEDVLQPLILQEKRRSGLDLFRTAETEPEPDLPPTPEHIDPDLSTSPPGIHNSTPTKRKGKRPHGKKLQSSSPLKQAPLRLPFISKRDKSETSGKHQVPEQEDAGLLSRELRRGRSAHAARGIPPPGPDSDQKKEKQELLAEIAQLEADIALAASANGKMRDAIEGGDGLSASALDRREMLDLLRRTALPADEADEPDPAANWLQAIANPISLLPFGKPSSDLSQTFLFDDPASEDKEPPPVSHHPIAMSASEELPYLQVFSPLAFASRILVLPQETPDAPLLQKHVISVTSTTPPGLFLAHIEMTVHSKSLKIAELKVPRIDATAEAELRPFVDRIASASHKEVGSALVRNITVLTWAMGEWVRVAVRRAKFWALLQRKLGTKDALETTIQKLREQSARGHRRKRQGHGADSEDDEDGEDELSSGVQRSGQGDNALPLTELLPYMGQSATDIDLPLSDGSANAKDASSVRVQWKIEFDWTGEAQSRIGILVGLPGKWRKADDRGRLARLPKLFDKMVRGNDDPARAVQTVVALLAGDGGL